MDGKDGLSPEELAAMEGEEENQTDEILEEIAGEEETDEAEETEEETESGDEDAAEKGAGEGPADEEESSQKRQEQPGAETGAAADAGGEDAARGALALPEIGEITVPENLPQVQFQFRDDGKVLPEFQPKFASLDEKYEAGEVTLSDYNAQRDTLRAEMNNLKADEQRWQTECETFWRHNQDWRPGSPLFDMLNGEVMRLAQSEQAQGLSGLQIIYAAQARVQQAIEGLHPSGKASVKKEAKPAKEAARPAAVRPPAATHALGATPAASPAETGGGEFAHLETLSGLDLERAVAAMTPDQRERWAQEN